jgi:tetratricopeptide (TPR) repeat protein
MANAEGVSPSRHEVERQLERMLCDPLFEARPKQAEVFAFLVRCALDGEEISELRVQKQCFPDPPYDPEASHVRTNVSSIRKDLLPEYYAGDGEDDPVIISLPDPRKNRTARGRIIKLPPGKAYTPSFSYNPKNWIAKELTVAFHLLRGGFSQIDQAMVQFDKVARAEPDHPEVTLGVVESWAIKLLTGFAGGPDEGLVASPLICLTQIEKAAGPSWRTHYLRAMLQFFMRDRKAAAKEFGKALKLDRQQTISRGGYTDFLFRTGREEQALRLMALEAEEHADNAQVHAMYGTHLARVRRFEDAARVLAKSLLLDPNGWVAHFGLWEMYLALGNQERAQEHADRLMALVTPEDFEFLRHRLFREQSPS